MIKVLITDKLAQEGIDLLNSIDGVEAVVKTGIAEDELAGIIGEHDGLIVRSGTKVTAKVLAEPGKLRGIARAGVGVDNIDVAEATRKGILVMNTPGGNTLSAAEHTMALILSMSRNVVPACYSLKSGAWDRKKYMGSQLNGKVLGVIGLGRIGLSVAQMAKGFNMKILGYDPFAAPTDADKLKIEITEELNQVFAEADYITVHVPRNEQTLNMIGAEQIAMMKPTVRLINCARGGIINEDVLYDALAEKRIGRVHGGAAPKHSFQGSRELSGDASPWREHGGSSDRGRCGGGSDSGGSAEGRDGSKCHQCSVGGWRDAGGGEPVRPACPAHWDTGQHYSSGAHQVR
jgi:D-3-phosphoglycerate dehydrogenase